MELESTVEILTQETKKLRQQVEKQEKQRVDMIEQMKTQSLQQLQYQKEDFEYQQKLSEKNFKQIVAQFQEDESKLKHTVRRLEEQVTEKDE